MYRVQLKIFALSLLLFIKLASTNPVPGPIPDVWDNLNGTAGEALSPFDIYLVEEHKFRVSAQLDLISTNDYYDANSTIIRDSEFDYYRINLPITFEYGIPGLFEIGFRVPYIVRNNRRYWIDYDYDRINASGWGDISARIRRVVYGNKDKLIYLALGGGIKFPTAQYDDYYYSIIPILSQGSLDFFFGAYSVIKTDIVKYPIAITFSHTGRNRLDEQVGEIITYRVGLMTDLGHFIDFNLGLKGYEILDLVEGNGKTSVEGNIIIRTIENRLNFSGGLVYDVRGIRSYIGTYPF
ncbi:MAG: hypothetical protein OEZ20_09185, partial [candidate division WOR-3 bacterium]|nr:hypothetical protein [candidate division WOR-3 bacterium]